MMFKLLFLVTALFASSSGLQESVKPFGQPSSETEVKPVDNGNDRQEVICDCEDERDYETFGDIFDYIFGGFMYDDFPSQHKELGYKKYKKKRDPDWLPPSQIRRRNRHRSRTRVTSSKISHAGHKRIKPEEPCHPEKESTCLNLNTSLSGSPTHLTCDMEHDFCVDDCDCPGTQKCCINSCGRRECLPSWSNAKPAVEVAGSHEKEESEEDKSQPEPVESTGGDDKQLPVEEYSKPDTDHQSGGSHDKSLTVVEEEETYPEQESGDYHEHEHEHSDSDHQTHGGDDKSLPVVEEKEQEEHPHHESHEHESAGDYDEHNSEVEEEHSHHEEDYHSDGGHDKSLPVVEEKEEEGSHSEADHHSNGSKDKSSPEVAEIHEDVHEDTHQESEHHSTGNGYDHHPDGEEEHSHHEGDYHSNENHDDIPHEEGDENAHSETDHQSTGGDDNKMPVMIKKLMKTDQ